MKEGIDLPEAMRAKSEYRNMQTMALNDAFKVEVHPLRVAIARANCVNEGKNNGLIVDYYGILKHLHKALATFAGTKPDGEGGEIDPTRPEEELLADLAEAIALVRAFLDGRHASLDDVMNKTGFERNAAIVACKEAANENDESRKRFKLPPGRRALEGDSSKAGGKAGGAVDAVGDCGA